MRSNDSLDISNVFAIKPFLATCKMTMGNRNANTQFICAFMCGCTDCSSQ